MISLDDIKRDLRVTHDEDDQLLQLHLDASIDEAKRFLDVKELPLQDEPDSELLSSSEAPGPTVAPSIYAAVSLLVRSKYEASADEIPKLRAAAETLLMPYRKGLGA